MKPNQTESPFLDLPEEALLHVFSFLGSQRNVSRLGKTCKQLNRISKDECLFEIVSKVTNLPKISSILLAANDDLIVGCEDGTVACIKKNSEYQFLTTAENVHVCGVHELKILGNGFMSVSAEKVNIWKWDEKDSKYITSQTISPNRAAQMVVVIDENHFEIRANQLYANESRLSSYARASTDKLFNLSYTSVFPYRFVQIVKLNKEWAFVHNDGKAMSLFVEEDNGLILSTPFAIQLAQGGIAYLSMLKNRIIIGSEDGSVDFIKYDKARDEYVSLQKIKLHDAPIKKIFFTGNQMFSISETGEMCVCDFNKATRQYEKVSSFKMPTSVDLIVGLSHGEFAIVDKEGQLSLISLNIQKILEKQVEANNNTNDNAQRPGLK